jgi:putative two-component system response regulator
MALVLYAEARVRTAGFPLAFHQPSASSGRVVFPERATVDVVTAVTGVRRALVVDDEPTIRTALARYLRRRGWEADEAEDGRTALRKLDRAAPGSYQVVVSDLRMPHCSGVELHDWLAMHRPDLFACLILTTGDLASPSLTEFVHRTPRPLIEKPFELAVLAQLIEAVARGR